MSRRTIGIALLLVGSEILGFLAGEWFYRLFLGSMPPLALSTFNRRATHVTFIASGLGAGVVVFLWSLLAAAAAPLFRGGGPKSP